LPLRRKAKTSQDGSSTRLGFVGLHFGKFRVHIAQGYIEAFSFMIQLGGIFGCVGQR
jgi:hypothetical protein